MDEDNTTVNDVQDTGAPALPVAESVAEPADVQPVAEPSEPQQDGEAAPQPVAPEVDDKLKKYAESNGIELDSPGAIKAAQIGLKAQSEATRNYRKASELEKAANITPDQLPADATPQQQENVRIRNLELKLDIQSWKSSNPEKLSLEADMVKILSDPNKRALVQEGYLSLDDVYAIAKGASPDNTAVIKSQGKQEALQSLAHKQQAAVPTGNATNPGLTPKEKPFKDLSIAEMEAKLGFVRQ